MEELLSELHKDKIKKIEIVLNFTIVEGVPTDNEIIVIAQVPSQSILECTFHPNCVIHTGFQWTTENNGNIWTVFNLS